MKKEIIKLLSDGKPRTLVQIAKAVGIKRSCAVDKLDYMVYNGTIKQEGARHYKINLTSPHSSR